MSRSFVFLSEDARPRCQVTGKALSKQVLGSPASRCRVYGFEF
jgi:hypothetical protein